MSNNELVLRRIYENLNNGYEYGEIGARQDFDCVLYTCHPYNYITWRNFGSSAVKNNIDELRYVINNIFEVSPYEFERKYLLRYIG